MVGTSTPLVVVELLAACIWVGSLACLAVVAKVARQVLEPPTQVVFFRTLGRRYAIVGPVSLFVAIGAGLALAWPPSTWSATVGAAVALAGVLVLATGAGMVQARGMTRRRRQAASSPVDPALAASLSRGRQLATGLRILMGALTLAVLVLAAQAITQG